MISVLQVSLLKLNRTCLKNKNIIQKEKVLNYSLYAPQTITFDPCLIVLLEPISLSNIADLGVQEWHSLQTVYYESWSQCESLEW